MIMHELYMQAAIELAKRAKGKTNPNPMVGCVIVKDGKIIAEGYHRHCGGIHAEVDALTNAKADVTHATMYVTLEPCSHHGKQPPCCEAIVQAKIGKVVIATLDPNPLVHGRGVLYLQAHNIDIEVGVCEDEVIRLNTHFNHYITTKTPYVLVKTAITLDGKIATKTGASQWISGIESREYVHQLRDEYTAIGVGVDTVIIDNPALTTRLPHQDIRSRKRIIFDTTGRIPLNAQVLNDAFVNETIIVTTSLMNDQTHAFIKQKGARVLTVGLKENHVDLREAMEALGALGIDSLLIEGGGNIIASALKAKIVNEVCVALAPKLIGGSDAKGFIGDLGVTNLSDAIELEFTHLHQSGRDFIVHAKVK